MHATLVFIQILVKNEINIRNIDMTTEFSWISSEGRKNFINGSIELTEEEKESLIANFTLT